MNNAQSFMAAFVVFLLGGCATFSEDGGTRQVNDALSKRGITQQAPWFP